MIKQFALLKILFLPTILFSKPIKLISPIPLKVGEKIVFSVNALGAYIGDQIITIDGTKQYKGQTVAYGGGSIKSTPFISVVYDLYDREVTYFLPKNITPVYNEKWIKEGGWIDRMWFYFYPGKIVYRNQQGKMQKKTLTYNGDEIRNFYTLIQFMRCVDFDYYIQKKLNIEVLYLFGETVTNAIFRPTQKTILFNGEKKEVYFLQELGGMSFEVTLQKGSLRIPLSLKIPAYSSSSYTIKFDVKLKKYIPGSKLLVNQ